MESAEAGFVNIFDYESNAADVSTIDEWVTLGYHVAAIESSVFGEESRQLRYSFVDISFGSGLAKSAHRIESHCEKIGCLSNILAMEIASTNKSVFKYSISFCIDKGIVSSAVHLLSN